VSFWCLRFLFGDLVGNGEQAGGGGWGLRAGAAYLRLGFVLTLFFARGGVPFFADDGQVSSLLLRINSGDYVVVGNGSVRPFCFISAKGWELIVIPGCGMRVPAVGVLAGGGGNLFLLTSTGKMPMVVHWRRCGFVVLWSYWILRLHMRGLRRRLQQDSGGRRRTSGPRRRADQKRLEAEDFAKESLYFFAFFFCSQGLCAIRGCIVTQI